MPPPIAKVIDGVHPRIEQCFEREHTKDANLRGTVDVFFLLGAGGNVMKVHPVYVPGLNDAVVTCAADVVEKLQFPVKPLEPQGHTARFTFGKP